MILIAIFRLIFSKAFWTPLRRRAFWRDTWFAMFRVHKDQRAQAQVRMALRLLCAMILLGGVVTTLVVAIGFSDSPATDVMGSVFAYVWLPALAVFTVLSFMAGGQSKRSTHSPREVRVWTDERLYRPSVRKEIAELTVTYAILLDRAGSEAFLAAKTLPVEIEVTTRQSHVSILRERGLWDRLGSKEKELLMRPDKGWEAVEIDNVINRLLEPMRMLRWVLRIDQFLPNAGQDPSAKMAMARELVNDPQRVLSGYDLISRCDLEMAREAAHAYFQRCWAEGVTRGYFEPQSEANLEWSKGYAERLEGREGDDLVIEATIVSKADEATIRQVTSVALLRLQTCDWLMRVISGKVGLKGELAVI